MSESGADCGDADAVLAGLIASLQQVAPAGDDRVRIDQIRRLEQLKSVAAAVQAEVIAEFVDSQRESQLAAGVRAEQCERGIASQVGLAMRCSPRRAGRHVGWAKIHHELPETFAQLRAGETSEWRALLMARETAWLSREHRAVVDAEVGPRLGRLGDKRTEAEAKAAAYRLDPSGYVARLSNADKDRHVVIRPAPDVMCRLSALLPVKEGIASHATLTGDADALKAAGDERSKGQIMADLLVERITGVATADGVPVEVNLTMSIDTLLAPEGERSTDDSKHGTDHEHGAADGVEDTTEAADTAEDVPAPAPSPGDEPAYVYGYGPMPAPLARDWLLDPDRSAPMWLRRLFTRPGSRELIGMESRRRLFTPAQARFIRARDQRCRTSWCEAPIRHIDHIVPAEHGGETSVHNAQGLCAACNFAKQATGWTARPGPRGSVTTETPAGHTYASDPPAPPGRPPPPARAWSPLEHRAAQIIYIHTHPHAA
jgi:hypothetical protein